MAKISPLAVLVLSAMLGMGCGPEPATPDLEGDEQEAGAFVPDADDEVIDAADPPDDPDPGGGDYDGEDEAAISSEAMVSCPKRGPKLSPKGLTFVIHISKHYGGAAYKQVKSVKHLIRARDIFMIEEDDDTVQKLRETFPCNDIHFIAYPDELPKAFAASDAIDGIAIDWEKGLWAHPQSWSVDKLEGYSKKIRDKGMKPSVVPYWPDHFNDGHVTKASKMGFELAQIQDECVDGPLQFAGAARALVKNFIANGLTARDVGFEISLNSFHYAPNHTGVDRSAACTRKAYGKGARAIYLYGNGHPHLDDYFKKIAKLGLRG